MSAQVEQVQCVAVTVTWPADDEAQNFLRWALDNEIFPVVRGGYTGSPPSKRGFPYLDATRRQHMGFYSPEDAERIAAWAAGGTRDSGR
mgnify:CR=1 FL=1